MPTGTADLSWAQTNYSTVVQLVDVSVPATFIGDRLVGGAFMSLDPLTPLSRETDEPPTKFDWIRTFRASRRVLCPGRDSQVVIVDSRPRRVKRSQQGSRNCEVGPGERGRQSACRNAALHS